MVRLHLTIFYIILYVYAYSDFSRASKCSNIESTKNRSHFKNNRIHWSNRKNQHIQNHEMIKEYEREMEEEERKKRTNKLQFQHTFNVNHTRRVEMTFEWHQFSNNQSSKKLFDIIFISDRQWTISKMDLFEYIKYHCPYYCAIAQASCILYYLLKIHTFFYSGHTYMGA